MDRAIQIAKLVFLIIGAAFLSITGWTVYGVNQKVQLLDPVKVQKLVVGDLALLGDTINHIDTTAKQVDHASVEQQQYLEAWNGQVTLAMQNTNSLLISLKRTSDGMASSEATLTGELSQTLGVTRTTISSLQPVTEASAKEVLEFQKETQQLEALNPILVEMAKNLNTTSANAAATTKNISDTTLDVKQAVHSYLHPTLFSKIYHAVANTGVEVAKFLW